MHPDEVTLGELVDGTLPAGERGEVERHVASCDECRATITALADVRDAARALPPLTPPEDAWRRIERAIHREPARRDRPAGWMAATRTHWLWLAAAAVLLVVTAVGLRTWNRPAVPAGQANAAPAAAQTAATADADSAAAAAVVEAELREAESHYQKAIAGLEQIANAEKGSLDPTTAATLEKNLAVIDRAITESRAALQTQPNSEPAQQSLLDSFKTKLALLQDTVALINEMRKGNDAGAARAVSGLKQKG